MEQTKNETKIENKTESKPENKTAPGNDKPKKERKPLTEAQRLKRQKMIVLPAMVLVFIGAMWLIFAPSSGKEQEREQAATISRCPMRTRRTAGLSVTRRKPTSRGQWRNGRRTAAAPCSSWATCSTAKRRQRMGTATSTLPIPAERKRR
mgnify:CR=1 FL=1